VRGGPQAERAQAACVGRRLVKRLLTTVGPLSGSTRTPEPALEALTQDIMGRAASFADPVLARPTRA
jgi:hypothetical protein